MRFLFFSFFLLFYILMPSLLHSFNELRTVLFLLAGVVFIAYCALRYYILLSIWGDRKRFLWRLLLDNGSLLLGLILLYIFEGFVYATTKTFNIPSIRFLFNGIACCCLIPTMNTNKIIKKIIDG
jgi:hypothetical protein